MRRFNHLFPSNRFRLNVNYSHYYKNHLYKLSSNVSDTQIKDKKVKKKTDEDEEYKREVRKIQYSDDEEINPQQQLAEVWHLTTDDKIQTVSENLRRFASSKRLPIYCTLAAYVAGKTGWYQFEFLGMPFEMEIVMVHLPFVFVAAHWTSWYLNMSKLFEQLSFKLPKNWVPNPGLLFGAKPQYHVLVDVNNKRNFDIIDNFTYQLNKHRTMAAILCCANISIIILTATINPLGDPALAALEPMQVIGYSFYPVLAYALTAVMYGSPVKQIGPLKDDIVEELGLDLSNMPDIDETDTDTNESGFNNK